MKSDAAYFQYVLECINRIEHYINDGEAAFRTDTKTQDAVLRNLHTLSETTQRLSDEFRADHPDIPWRAISAFRNTVVHDYLGVDLDPIWRIVTVDLPDLKRKLQG